MSLYKLVSNILIFLLCHEYSLLLSFNVELKSAGGSKIAVIKVIREITGLGLKEAKDLADNGWVIKENVSKDDANEIKTKLEAEGASVEVK